MKRLSVILLALACAAASAAALLLPIASPSLLEAPPPCAFSSPCWLPMASPILPGQKSLPPPAATSLPVPGRPELSGQ